MEDRYENLKDIETAINTKPIKEIVKHIDFTECLDKITLESYWTKNNFENNCRTKNNFENNRIIDKELLLADNFKDPTTEIVEQKQLITYIDDEKQKVFDYIIKKLENAQILETLTN